MKKDSRYLLGYLGIILTILGLVLPIIKVGGTDIILIKDVIGKIILFLSIISIIFLIIKLTKVNIITSVMNIVLIIYFYISKSNSLKEITGIVQGEFSIGLYLIIIGLVLLLIISIIYMNQEIEGVVILPKKIREKIYKIRAKKQKNKYKTCPNCGATLLAKADNCFLCNKNLK